MADALSETTTFIGTEKPLKAIISPSVLASDFALLAEESNRMINCGADWLHLDIMDGHFVPNISFGPPVVKSLRKHTTAFFDCHLMVSDPKRWISDFQSSGANQFTFHIEAVGSTAEAVEIAKEVRRVGMRCGISVKPKTPVEAVFPSIDTGLFDLLLIMTVEPGFGGQKFMEDMMSKVKAARRRYPTLNIQVDGGLDIESNKLTSEAGANVVVAGTSIFGSSDPSNTISELRRTIKDRIARQSA